MVLKLVAQILASSIRSNGFDFLAKLILNFVLKIFELFKGLRFGTHQIDISISTIIFRKRNEISVASSCLYAHRSTYIGMYEFQQVVGPLSYLGERHLCHLSKQTRLSTPI